MMPKTDSFSVDFFLIGVPKSGTTWFAQCLNEHPEIFIPTVKEPNFFVESFDIYYGKHNSQYLKDPKWYESLYKSASSEQRLGDCSVNMLSNGEACASVLAKWFPKAKLIVLLRDPTKRAYSHYWYDKRYDFMCDVPTTFENALASERFFDSGNYYDLLMTWFAYFPAEQFQIVLDIDIKKDPLKALQSSFHFLNVERSFVPNSVVERVNEAYEFSNMYIVTTRLAKTVRRVGFGFLVDALNGVGLGRIQDHYGKRATPYPPISSETEKYLRKTYDLSIVKLENLLGRDLSEWRG